MKSLITLVFSALLLAFSGHAQTLRIQDFKHDIPDITSQKKDVQDIYQKLSMDLVRVKDSICSNRAHLWAYDLKRKFNVEPAKIFLFYTPKNSRFQGVSWWYHVAPLLNVKGKYWVLDKGFPYMIKSSLPKEEWLKTFTGEKSVCKEIQAKDVDLLERMFQPHIFPEQTSHGRYDCYYIITPGPYWTPSSVAKHLLGKDSNGRPIHFARDEFDLDEVFESCMEAATTPIGWAWGTALNRCRNFLVQGVL